MWWTYLVSFLRWEKKGFGWCRPNSNTSAFINVFWLYWKARRMILKSTRFTKMKDLKMTKASPKVACSKSALLICDFLYAKDVFDYWKKNQLFLKNLHYEECSQEICRKLVYIWDDWLDFVFLYSNKSIYHFDQFLEWNFRSSRSSPPFGSSRSSPVHFIDSSRRVVASHVFVHLCSVLPKLLKKGDLPAVPR